MRADDALNQAKLYTKKTVLGMGAIKGDKGDKGDTGTTYTPVIGTVRTVDNLTDAAASVVTNATTKKATFSFDIPQGLQGPQGEKGDKGDIGDAYTPQIGDVLTVDSTSEASITVALDEANKKATFNFNIPKGEAGAKGDTGEKGEKGDTGLQGIQGLQGERGEQGPAGVEGPQGIQGIKGDKGDDGYPFLIYKQYEVGLEEFNEADYPEIGLMFMVHVWEENKGYPVYRYTADGTTTPYSLVTHMNTEGIKGEKGDKGDQGEQGVQGIAGNDGVDGITFTPEIGEVNTVDSSAGASVTIEVKQDEGRAIYNFDIPKGVDGTNGMDGTNGVDGVSPTFEIIPTATGNTIKMADVNGVHSFDVNNGVNGADGQNGIDGNNGVDGFSPIVTVTETADGHNVAIQDVNGVQNFEVLNGKGVITSLEELGLTAPTTVGEVFVAMPDESMLMLNVENVADANVTITDAPHNYGLLTIEKHSNSRFRIEYSNSLGGNASDARKWIGSIKGNDGTGLRWIELTGSAKIYTTMAQLGLDGATATVQDVIDAISIGETAMLRSDAFNNNNWQTQCNGIQYGYLKIEKTQNGLSNIELQEVVAPNRRYFGTQASGKFAGWTQMNTEEILHTSLSGNLAGITTVLDLVNALLTEYRALNPKKIVRFVSGEITKTTLTDFPITYGVLQITVAGWDVVEVRLAHSANGFKSMYYGFLTRITGQESISSIAWEKVATTKVADVARTALTFNESVKATTSNSLSQSNSYIVRNGICYVSIDITTNSVATDVNTTVNIADGLPTPAQHTSSTAAPFGKTSTTGVVYISTTGNLCGRSLISNSRYVLSFSYPVAD